MIWRKRLNSLQSEKPELARGDCAKEIKDAERFTDRNLVKYPETKRERWQREYQDDRYGG